ncbi:MAG: DUF1302 family protein [Pseudomonadales bacterium]|nr:DUF1302 family protein [Pseudomonadales bacterium]
MIKLASRYKQSGKTPTLAKVIGTGALLTLPLSSQAIQLQFDDPSMSGFVDTTVSIGGIWRTEDPDTSKPLNASNKNFEQSGELVSTPFKLTVEAGFSKNSKGVFVRGNYIYDAKIQGLDTSVFNITSKSQDEIGNKFQLLDAFIYGNFAFGEKMLSVRAGNQVLSWGESTYIGNSLNSINPIDATKARGAAIETKELILPLPMIWASLDFGGEFSIEAYYVAKWTETIIDPVGTFFSTTDAVGEGSSTSITISSALGPAGVVPRGPDIEPDDGGEYGFAFRKLMEDWEYMEIAFYYMRQSSHTPFFQATQGSVLLASPPYPAGTPDFSTGSFQIIYPEDIDVWGASFNVDLPGDLGISLAGEVSYRPDTPLSLGANTFGVFGLGLGTVVNYSRANVTQVQTTITYQGGSNNWFGGDKMTILVEPGVVFTDLPSSGPLDAAAFASMDPVSWGYVALVKVEYSDALFDMTLEPAVTFKHDAKGSSPNGTFLQDRKSVTVGVTATYLTSTTFDLGYTANWGNQDANSAYDRDFFALTFKYSF